MSKKNQLPANVIKLNPPAEINPPAPLTRRGRVALGVGTAAAGTALVAGAWLSHPGATENHPQPNDNQATTYEQNLEHSRQIEVIENDSGAQEIPVNVTQPSPVDIPTVEDLGVR